MDNKLYGQADYCYAVSKIILQKLSEKGLISEEQKARIDEFNRRMIFASYPSVAELELRV